MQQHILIIQDISCIGRCSLLAALPLFNDAGIRATPLPTALLSSHTGFPNPARRDLTEDMSAALDQWQKLDLRFDAIHIGYLAGAHQLPVAQRALDLFRREDTKLFVDPVMGDWGKAYSYCDEALLQGFQALCAQADLILPNRTEAAMLLGLLKKIGEGSVLVFTRTKHRAKRLAAQLGASGYRAASLQGNLSQRQRQAALDGFKSGQHQILVATDLAARGIDVEAISHVINFDMPATVDDYTHRIGRTGRAAKTGDAFTFTTHEDESSVRAIERVMGFKIERRRLEGFDYSAKPAAPAAHAQGPHRPHSGPKPGGGKPGGQPGGQSRKPHPGGSRSFGKRRFSR